MIALPIFIVLTFVVALEGFLAFRDDMLTVRQMQKDCRCIGMPFISHLGMWGDLLIVNPITSIAAAYYLDQWSRSNMIWYAPIIAGAVTIAAHEMWKRGDLPDSLACNGRVKAAGCVHFFYMCIQFTAILLLFFATPTVGHAFLITASILLSVHVLIGIDHVVLGFFNTSWWGEGNSRSMSSWMSIVVLWGLIWGRTVWIVAH